MINCPNCGTPVREDVKFCGNCGVDVQAALAAQQQAMAAQAAVYQPQPLQPIQQAYPLQTTYSAFDLRREESSPMRGRVLVAVILVVAVACAFCCGVIFGLWVFDFLPSAPKTVPTPTRQSFELLHLISRLVG